MNTFARFDAARLPGLLALAAGLLLMSGGRRSAFAEEPSRLTVIPYVDSAPVIDGDLDDEVWAGAVTVSDFTKPSSREPVAKKVISRICFDREALYVAFTCVEPHPERMRTRQPDGEQVWLDDCVEVWIRTTNNLYEFDQFIVNSVGRKETLRRRQERPSQAKPRLPECLAACKVDKSEWRAEIRIPFRTLDIQRPEPGEMVQLKLGREDRAGDGTALSTWPPASPYAGTGGYSPVYFEKANLIRNPALSERSEGRAAGWSATEGDEDKFASAEQEGERVIRIDAPGRYCTLSQSLRLRPNTLYRLEAEVRGAAGAYIRARSEDGKGASVPHTVWFKPSGEYVAGQVRFFSGPKGDVLLILGGTEGTGVGRVEIRGLRLVRDVFCPAWGEAIPVAPGADPLVVRKLPVADCRAVRGFIGTPVDGSLKSRAWDGGIWEYNQRGAGVGVGYSFMGNDGLHVTLGDAGGFNALVVRGGVRSQVYVDCPSYESSDGGALLAEFPGRSMNSRLFRKQTVAAKRVSFFDVGDGYISNLSFFRLGTTETGPRGTARRLAVKGAVGETPAFVAERFGEGHRATYVLEPGEGGAGIAVEPGTTIHFVTRLQPEDTALSAVALDMMVGDALPDLAFTASVQDPLNPRSELYGADFVLSNPGRLRLILDFPDQVLPAGSSVWLSLKFEGPAVLSGAEGGGPAFDLVEITREEALPEALAYRKLLLKAFFDSLSEARPWNSWYTDEQIERSLASNLGPQLKELTSALDHCYGLAPQDPVVRQYYEWIWRRNRRWRSDHGRGIYLDGSHARIGEVPGAPEWAVVARQAWLEARKVPLWWLDNRLAPTGEFGGVVGDDSDMYQNYADFVMFETGGAAARLKDAAARLAELAEKENLTDGLNRYTTDPLHAYEEGVNHEALMAWWFYGDPVYFERCMVAARSTESLTLVTPRGHRHFKSQMCGAADLRMDRKTDVDGHAHPLMWHPAFEVAWYNGSPRVLKMLREWADGWLEHMQPGRYALSVEVANEKVVDTTDVPLYGGYGGQGSAFEFLYWVTGEEKYLGPFMEQLEAGRARTSPGNIVPELLHRHGLKNVGGKLPELVKGRGVAETLLTGGKKPLIDALKTDIAELQNYSVMYMTAEPFTDRVFLYGITNAAIAYTGGYATRNKYCHTHAVSYEGFGAEYAALVLAAGPDRFKALLYSFSEKELPGVVRFWTLGHGRYQVSLGPDEDLDDRADSIEKRWSLEIARATAVPLALPPRKVMVLEVTLRAKMDDIRSRADLALSPLELRTGRGEVSGIVHNIGSKAARRVEVALVDQRGRTRARTMLGDIEAPLDLVPRRASFILKGLPANAEGWCVRVDPRDRIPEIYEGNNSLAIASR